MALSQLLGSRTSVWKQIFCALLEGASNRALWFTQGQHGRGREAALIRYKDYLNLVWECVPLCDTRDCRVRLHAALARSCTSCK